MQMRKSVARILKLDTTSNLGFSVSYVDTDDVTHNYTVFSNEQFRQIAKQMFGQRVYDDWDSESTDNELLADFIASFGVWKGSRQDTYSRRMYALDQKFNPLENYRAHEHREGEVEHGEQIDLTFDNRKDKHTDDSFVEKSYTNYKETEKDDTSVTRSYTNYKETEKDDTSVTHSYTNYKETEQDDSSVTHSYTDYSETTTDDSSVTHSYTDYSETTTDDSSVTRSYTNYQETLGNAQQTHTHNISADDSNAFVASSQDIDSAHDDTKSIAGSYKDTNGYTLGNVKTIEGSTTDQKGFVQGNVKTIEGSTTDQKGFVQGNVKTIEGSTTDQKGYVLGDVKTIEGSTTDQKGYVLGDVKTIEGSVKDQKGYTLGAIDSKEGKETTAHSGTDTDEYTLDRYGNIGVTTSQQMLASDLDLLKYDITMTAIREFFGMYTFVSEEVS